jgi:hypothetical protein
MDFELAKQQIKVMFKWNEFSLCELHFTSLWL